MRCITAICPAGPPKLSTRDPQPDPEGLAEADAVTGDSASPASVVVDVDIDHGFALLVGQLWVSPVASRHQR